MSYNTFQEISTTGTKKSSITKCQVPAKKKTELEKELVKGGFESKNKKSRNVSAFKCKVIPINVFDPLAVTETFAEKDQSKDLSQAIHLAKVIELPKRSENPIEINANIMKETARIEEDLNFKNEIENLLLSPVHVEEPSKKPDGSEGHEDLFHEPKLKKRKRVGQKVQHKCSSCDIVFLRKQRLKEHNDSVHEGKKEIISMYPM